MGKALEISIMLLLCSWDETRWWMESWHLQAIAECLWSRVYRTMALCYVMHITWSWVF